VCGSPLDREAPTHTHKGLAVAADLVRALSGWVIGSVPSLEVGHVAVAAEEQGHGRCV